MLNDTFDDRNKIEEFYKRTEKSSRTDVEGLRIWILTNFQLKEISEYFIILCYHSCYHNIADTKKCIENFLVYKIKHPNLFQYKSLHSGEVKRALSSTLQTVLPKRTKENYDIVYFRVLDTNSNSYNCERQFMLTNMTCFLHFYQRTVSDGLIFIVDFSDISFGHICRLNLFIAKTFIGYVQEALPVRLKGIHIINASYVSEKLVKMLFPFLNQRTRTMFKCHTCMDSVYEIVPKDLLPVEVGGNCGTIRELHGNFPGECFKFHIFSIPAAILENVEKNSDFFREDEDAIDILKSVFQKNKK